MAKTLPASNKVMKNYLSELMTDEMLVDEKKFETPADNKKLEKLLSNVSIEVPKVTVTTYKSENKISTPSKPVITKAEAKVAVKAEVTEKIEIPLATKKSQGGLKLTPEKNYSRDSFQAMFFDVAGLTIAVPLIELGGIHNISDTTKLMGKPEWFKGVMLNRDEKINVVDTALWVMPEKCNENLKNSLNYQYIIMLSDSKWGLTAEHLVDTVTLHENDVKWVDSTSKRPWLAGLVKDRMCALLDVESLIGLLNEGENIHQQ
ncbi:MAG: chemotaxis protein CheW [Thalassotalea sp.]